MTDRAKVGKVETVKAWGWLNRDGNLGCCAYHRKEYALGEPIVRGVRSVHVRIIRETDWRKIQAALKAASKGTK